MSAFSFLGTAKAYVDILTDEGGRTGLELKGNCSEFTPKPDSDIKEQTGNWPENFGQVIASVTIPKPMKATIKFNQLDQQMFAAAFFGTSETLTQAAGSVPDQEITALAGKFVELGKYLISDVAVTTNDATPVALVEGTDYTVNANLGMIRLLSTSTVASDGDTLLVSYSHAAVSGSSMSAMTKSNVRIRIKLDGQNYADGRRFVSEIYQLRLAPSANFSLIGTDFVEVTFEGTLETPDGYNEPMKHVWLS